MPRLLESQIRVSSQSINEAQQPRTFLGRDITVTTSWPRLLMHISSVFAYLFSCTIPAYPFSQGQAKEPSLRVNFDKGAETRQE